MGKVSCFHTIITGLGSGAPGFNFFLVLLKGAPEGCSRMVLLFVTLSLS